MGAGSSHGRNSRPPHPSWATNPGAHVTGCEYLVTDGWTEVVTLVFPGHPQKPKPQNPDPLPRSLSDPRPSFLCSE